MRTWTRVAVPTYCGGCGNLVPAEGAVLHVSIPGVKKQKVRCEECEGPAPKDLPELEPHEVPALDEMIPTRKLAAEFQGKIWKRG